MYAVPPGAGAHQEQHVPHLAGCGRGDAVGPDQAHAHGVDQWILRIRLVEADLASYVGHADAIAVPRDAAHHAMKQVPVLRVVQGAEAKGVEQGDGTGAHGQDVPNDAAHAGGRSLQRLHCGGMVVGLDLEHHRQAVADVHRAGVLRAGLGQDPGRFLPGRVLIEQAQQGPGVLIAAVLAPKRPEHAQFNRVGLPAQTL